MKPIRWGIIGCGDVTEVKSGPAFQKVAGSTLVAVMRRDGAKAEDYARRHQVPNWYTDADLLIHDPAIDAIYVATPPASHEAYTLAALAARKPVYVEKPMSLNRASAERMLAAARAYETKLCVAHYRRAMPMFNQIKQVIDTGVLGDIRFINLRLLQPPASAIMAKSDENWRVNPDISGGGLFFDLAPHQLDLMRYFFGPIQDAYGLCANQAGLYAAEDIVSGVMRLPNNVLFTGQWCFTMPEGMSEDVCEIVGSVGRLRFTVFGNQYSLQTRDHNETVTVEQPAHVQQPMIAEVVRYFAGEGPNPCPPEEAVEIMTVMDTFIGRRG